MVDTPPHPFRTDPFLRTKVWGGTKLETLFGKSGGNGGDPVGETWEVADLEEGECRSATGPTAGTPLSGLVEAWGEALVGTESPSSAFPLLVKIIDAAEDLSVQVHPSEEDVAKAFPEADSKDECWLVLDADPDGAILHGLREGVDRESFRQAVDEGRADELLRRIQVRPGHVVRVVPGTIHAICGGVTLLEIQQPSDTTYRVYDYDRVGLDGEPRELHLQEAMSVANFDHQPPTELTGKQTPFEGAEVELLADVPAYRIERTALDVPVQWRVASTSPQVLFAVGGSGKVSAPGNETLEHPIELRRGETVVAPAGVESLRVDPADDELELVVAGLGGAPLMAR